MLVLLWACPAQLACDATDGCLLLNSNVVGLGAAETLTQPQEVSASTIALSVEFCTASIANFAAFTTRCYCYGSSCTVPGPTIVTSPGATLTVTFTNSLGANPTGAVTANTMHSPNTVNLHTHGLHVDPAVDSIFVEVEPGESHTYAYQLPSDHHPGFHWYHSHHHGSSTFQVMGGLVGGLRVEPSSASDLPTALQAMARVTMVVHHIALDNSDTSTDPFTVWTYTDLHGRVGATDSIGASYSYSSVTDAWAVNGQYQPQHAMAPGEWQIFDVVNAAGDRILELEINTALQTADVGDPASVSTATTSGECSSYLLAVDGVYLDTARSGPHVDHLVLVQAQRVSLAVKCDTAGTYFLQTAYSSSVTNYEAASVQNLVTLVVSGGAVSMSAPTADQTSISKPWYLNDLTSTASSASWSIAVEQTGCCDDAAATYWLGIGDDCSMAVFGRAEGDALCASGGSCATDCAFSCATCDGSDKYGSCSGTDWAGVSSYPPSCNYASMDGEQGASGSYAHVAQLGTVETMTIWGRRATLASVAAPTPLPPPHLTRTRLCSASRGKAPHPIHIHVRASIRPARDELRSDRLSPEIIGQPLPVRRVHQGHGAGCYRGVVRQDRRLSRHLSGAGRLGGDAGRIC